MIGQTWRSEIREFRDEKTGRTIRQVTSTGNNVHLYHPHLRRIFDQFEGLIRIYHNDTPCPRLLSGLVEANFDVFNFSHKMDIGEVKAVMGHRVALMGNVPPLDVGVRGKPVEVMDWARVCMDKAAPGGGMILSFGGGVSPGTPPENVDALLSAAREWSTSSDRERR